MGPDDWQDEWYTFWYEEVWDTNEWPAHDQDKDRHTRKPEKKITRRQHFLRQAKTSSIKGDHPTAIKFYEDALENSFNSTQKCEVLSAIAGEYETIGDYGSAEKYWNRCCQTELHGGEGTAYRHLAGKGDFLYRRDRYSEAISYMKRH